MARLARLTFVGYPHHVAQRGNAGRSIFETEADFRRYLDWLKVYVHRYSVDVWAYCLMPDHVHYVCVPRREGLMARAFNTIHMRYAQYCNTSKAFGGGQVWRPRFMSCVLDKASVREEVRFVENNPVRRGLVSRAEDYPWSSARSRVTGICDGVLTDGCFLSAEIRDWGAYLTADGDEAVIARVRSGLKTGRPAGDPEFIETLESIAGRRLRALPRGRPRKDHVPSAAKTSSHGETQ
jgi:putative transposase